MLANYMMSLWVSSKLKLATIKIITIKNVRTLLKYVQQHVFINLF